MKIERINLSTNEKIGIISNLATMLSAGIPILETVDSLLEDAKGNQKKLLMALREDLGQGQHVYHTFSRFPKIFDKVTVNIIKASEEAGQLDVALKDLKAKIKKDSEFTDKIRSALIYPVFIFVVFIVVMLVILVVVMPKISSVFLRMDVELPLPTKLLIAASNLLITKTMYVILVVGAIVGILVFSYINLKKQFINFLISLPVVSQLARYIDLTRFSRSIYLLLSAGLPITTALALTQEIMIKKDIERAIYTAKIYVESGKKFSEGLKVSKRILPAIMIKIVEAGERTGTLDKSMMDISEFLDYEVEGKLKTATALIEPLMLVLIGVLIGGMMMAIMAPIYSMIGQVGAPR